MFKQVFVIRGAITIDTDTKESVSENCISLLTEIIQKNNIKEKEAVSLLISSTNDIHSYYPAAAVRESNLLSVPLFSAAEPEIKGSLSMCIRFMLTVMKKRKFEPRHVYLKNAKKLRPDLN